MFLGAPTLADIAIALVVGIAAAAVGGGLGGVFIAGKEIGHQLSAFVGAFYGVIAGTAGVVVGLIVLTAISWVMTYA